VKKVVASFPVYQGKVNIFEKQYLAGEVELELVPQGTLAERIRAGGAGITGFYTPSGVGTLIEEGKEKRTFEGKEYLLELPLKADVALIKADKADKAGNLLISDDLKNSQTRLLLGYGKSLLSSVSAGFNLKVLLRAKSSIEGTVLEVIDQVSDTSEIPISKAVGFGGDIGLLYFPNAWLSVALCAKDFFGTRFSSWEALNQSTPFERSLIKPRIVFGLAFYPLIAGGETKNFKNFIIALDYSDLLDYTSIFTNVKLGIGFDTLRILRLRSGFDGGYPTFGIGFDLNVFQMNIVYFVDELGAYTGAQPVQNLMLNFAFRW